MNKQNKCNLEKLYICTAYTRGQHYVTLMRSYGYKEGKGWKSCPFFKQRRDCPHGMYDSPCVHCNRGLCECQQAQEDAECQAN
jgi:hypothetical protein